MTDHTNIIRILLIIAASILLLPILVMFLAWPMMAAWGGGHMWNGAMGVWVFPLMGIPILLLVIVGVYLLLRAIRDVGESRRDPAIEELRLAYARGDLSDQEYEERRDRLEGEG